MISYRESLRLVLGLGKKISILVLGQKKIKKMRKSIIPRLSDELILKKWHSKDKFEDCLGQA